ncbi:head GIN domain-containing protein [Flavobacterium litorale]|uniref:DUF2807 domain-containing protein n=1 Tax=Flavobacterium litorale TaxID=2856519 RepID=A0ABX8VDX1_9FLAO|nr:head GIN domain-containing protein [Flavobacterium litorale]QYJ69040.1 DUF2807 domain-containing protein [Flavobacterium litorale]
MKKLILVALLTISQCINAQEVTKKLGDFSVVKVFDMINVTLVKSSENKIEIVGDRANEVVVVNKNGKLKIKMEFTKLLAGEDIEATLYYTGTIREIEANEGSYIGSSDVLKVTSLDLNAKEGATIKVEMDVQHLNSKISSGGIAELYGKCINHEVKINSGGILEAKQLITEQTEIKVSAGGEVEIYATDYVNAKVTAGGDIDVYGNPSQVDKKTTFGGRIRIK